jgi:hypothetical protein
MRDEVGSSLMSFAQFICEIFYLATPDKTAEAVTTSKFESMY